MENLTVHSQWSFILLTWTPPFSLDITGVDLDLWYCVEVYNISQGRVPLTANCSVYETQFYFTAPNHSPCDLFEFRVFAVNPVGNGSVVSVSETFYASKYQTSKYYLLSFSAAYSSALHVLAMIFCHFCSIISHRTIFWCCWYSGWISFNHGNWSEAVFHGKQCLLVSQGLCIWFLEHSITLIFICNQWTAAF